MLDLNHLDYTWKIGAATWERCSAFAARYPRILLFTVVAFTLFPNVSALAVSRVIEVVFDGHFSALGCAVEAMLQAARTAGNKVAASWIKFEALVAGKLGDILTLKHVRTPWQAPGGITEAPPYAPSPVPQQPVRPPAATWMEFLTQIWLCALSVMMGACCCGGYGGFVE